MSQYLRVNRTFFLLTLAGSLLYARVERYADHLGASTLEIAGQTLELNGVAIHRRFVFDIYQVALYLKYPTRIPAEVLESNDLKFARMEFLRDIDAEDLRDGF